uniref:Uncharacterized protein n=1 Tax=Setaria italica TaxID=4555 RepID=K3Y0L0_SETIT
MCQIKVLSAPLGRSQTGITVFYLCYHHPNQQINGIKSASSWTISDLPIQYERTIMVNLNNQDWALSPSKFHII